MLGKRISLQSTTRAPLITKYKTNWHLDATPSIEVRNEMYKEQNKSIKFQVFSQRDSVKTKQPHDAHELLIRHNRVIIDYALIGAIWQRENNNQRGQTIAGLWNKHAEEMSNETKYIHALLLIHASA